MLNNIITCIIAIAWIISTQALSEYNNTNILPTIDIQSSLTEAWIQPHDTADYQFTCITGHAVILSTGTKDLLSGAISHAVGQVSIKVESQDLPIWIISGNAFEKLILKKGMEYSFQTNDFGRFSFTIPIEHDGVFYMRLPEILFRSESMHSDEWIVSHPDYDAFDRFSKLNGSHFKAMGIPADESSINHAAELISVLSKLSLESIPEALINDRDSNTIVKRSHGHSSMTFDSKKLPFYNSKTNRIATYLIKKSSSLINFKRKFQNSKKNLDVDFIVGDGYVSSSKNSKLQKRESNSWWKQAKEQHELGKTISGSLSQAANISNAGIYYQKSTNKFIILFKQEQSNLFLFQVMDSPSSAWNFIKFTLSKLKVNLASISKKVRAVFNWGSIRRTHRFLLKMHKLSGHYSVIGTSKMIPKINDHLDSFGNISETFFQNQMSGFGVANHTFSSLLESPELKHAEKVIDIDSKSSKNNAQVNYAHDMLMTNLNSAEPINEGSFEDNMNNLRILGSQVAECMEKEIPPDYRSYIQSYVLEFKESTSFFDKNMAKIINTVRTLAKLVQVLLKISVKAFSKFLLVGANLLTTLLELPIRVPFLTKFWKNVIAPNSGDLTIMSIYTLYGAIPSTTFFRIYHGAEPFSENDIAVLEKTIAPQLYLHNWNTHELTATNDKSIILKRQGIFDWIPRMSAASLLSLVVAYSITVGGQTALFGRITIAFLVLMWVYPFSQLNSNDPKAIETDLDTPEPRLFAVWTAYSVGLVTKCVNLATNKFKTFVDKFYSLIVGVTQTIAFNSFLIDIYKMSDRKDWKRNALFAVNAVAWEADNMSFLTGLMPKAWSDRIELGVLEIMATAYEARAHLMMGLEIVGLFPPQKE